MMMVIMTMMIVSIILTHNILVRSIGHYSADSNAMNQYDVSIKLTIIIIIIIIIIIHQHHHTSSSSYIIIIITQWYSLSLTNR